MLMPKDRILHQQAETMVSNMLLGLDRFLTFHKKNYVILIVASNPFWCQNAPR